MNPYLLTIILSILPISELRGGLTYGILNKLPILPCFFICVFFNILIVPILFFFLDFINPYLLKIKYYKRFFEFVLNKRIKKLKKKYETLTFLLLFLFVAIPAPGTGAYTGVLLSWFFKMNRKKSYLIIALGVLAAGIITLILLIGLQNLKIFLKL